MSQPNGPSSAESPQGRRVLVAVVTGEPGQRIQSWREQHDAVQARRLPPHTTLCYWVDEVDVEELGAQVRHAFAEPVTVRLGSVHEFDNDQQTFYVEVGDTVGLDSARHRLHDGTHVQLVGLREWTWHVTCVRDSRDRDVERLREHAQGLVIDEDWPVTEVACLELRGDSYEPVAVWQV